MANLDRFSCGVTTKAPDEVGICRACGGTIYDYEFRQCDSCEAQIHHGCTKECDECGHLGCKACLKENEEGLLLCEVCRQEQEQEETESEQPVTLVGVVRAATEKLS